MDDSLEWRYEQTENGWAVVADNLPGYRAEVRAVVPTKGHKLRTWTICEQQQVIAQGTAVSTALAKRQCATYLQIAQRYPPFDPLPPLSSIVA